MAVSYGTLEIKPDVVLTIRVMLASHATPPQHCLLTTARLLVLQHMLKYASSRVEISLKHLPAHAYSRSGPPRTTASRDGVSAFICVQHAQLLILCLRSSIFRTIMSTLIPIGVMSVYQCMYIL
jgi:hypothetical protein